MESIGLRQTANLVNSEAPEDRQRSLGDARHFNSRVASHRGPNWQLNPPPANSFASNIEIVDQIETALAKSGYPLQGVRCQADGQSLILVGHVTRYFYAQVALTVAMTHAKRCRINTRVEVLPRLKTDS